MLENEREYSSVSSSEAASRSDSGCHRAQGPSARRVSVECVVKCRQILCVVTNELLLQDYLFALVLHNLNLLTICFKPLNQVLVDITIIVHLRAGGFIASCY